MSRLWSALVLGAVSLTAAPDPALVPVGALWRWSPAPGPDGTFPPDWRELEFEDRDWPAARSGFSTSPWGTESTLLPPAPAGRAWCLRATFELADPAEVVWLVLRVDWTGGFAAWVNGVEFVRTNLPGNAGEPLPLGAVPLTNRFAGAAEEWAAAEMVMAALRPGRNVLALQWHVPPGFTGSLVPELRANFTRGPVVQRTTATSLTLLWRTPRPATTEVHLGRAPGALEPVFVADLAATQHVAMLTGLQPATEYWYRVQSRAGDRLARSPPQPVRTLPEAGGLRFAVMADVGGGGAPQLDVAAVLGRAGPDLVLIAGDTVYPKFSDRLADQRFFSVYRELMAGTPFFVVAGNHDTTYGPPWEFVDAFVCPTNDTDAATLAAESTWPEAYYSFDCGDAHFVGLYLPISYAGLELRPGKAQWRWLEADLAASRKPWKFLFLHHPLMSSGPHGRDDHNFNGVADPEELAVVLLPLARRHGVQMIFSGHDHAYERFCPVQGVTCVVTGGGGGSLYPATWRAPASAQFHLRWHAVLVEVAGDALHLRAMDRDGTVFDEMHLHRVPPPAAGHPAAWHTPAELPEPAVADGDGNFAGQFFDLVGPPLPSAPGEFSNLGLGHVNRDRTHLYLGFRHVALPDDGNLFVFLEVPGREGVTSLVGQGNGVVDPDGEGVDGLDFLENLAFANFRPALAAVLGDEFADAPARGYWRTNIVAAGGGLTVRTNLPLPIGQGVFWLQPGFPEVAGARLQQFNRSPQNGGVPQEQNADFIVLALPLAELGLRGDETLRLGAVVGGGSLDLERQWRELDAAFLGTHLEGHGLGPVVLEGRAVRLGDALDPAGDPDGDGATNAAELVAGTDPRDPASVLRLGVRQTAAGQFELIWPAVPGRTYQLEKALHPGGPFTDVAGPDFPRRAVGPQETWPLPTAPDTETRFYRLKVTH